MTGEVVKGTEHGTQPGLPLPVTVIGGYLGAGKTTLVNHLLRHAAGRRVAVLVNDFGALPIDADLIEAADGEVLSLSGGCLCCSFGSDLAAALRRFTPSVRQCSDQRNTAEMPPVDHLLVECSGVALPDIIAANAGLVEGVCVRCVIIVAGAEEIVAQARDPYVGDTVRRQLSAGQIVILNKVDLVSRSQRQECEALLHLHVPNAHVIPACNGVVKVDAALGDVAVQLPRARDTGAGTPLNAPHHSASPAGAGAEGAFASFVLDLSAASGLPEAPELARLLARAEFGLERAKGVVATRAGTYRIDIVGRRWFATPAPGRKPTAMVCIGRRNRMQETALRAAVRGLA